eukprot:CAMPEP_0168198246 /NCGR_PEP_ID=MMETSP0139_2-20121125/21656_1 /TAXON_ID=44445 /ORGANISM="Pseudo-nitzschia australis, Strain 10249 10 AB" /LENGTH=656 /DNA_ID=CAMNT_0008122893 /DNA_START=277 /DNA_END=2247 /DNA_ORIENTATION=-
MSEFRQRASGRVHPQPPPPPANPQQQQQQQHATTTQRRSSSGSSLPRPGFAPPARPVAPGPMANQNRSFSNASIGSGTNGMSSSHAAQRPYAAYTSPQSYNPNMNGYGSSSNSNHNHSSTSNHSSSNSNNYGMSTDRGDPDRDKYAKKPKRGASASGSNGVGGMAMVVGAIVLFCYGILMTTLYYSKNSQTNSMLSKLDHKDTHAVVATVESLKNRLTRSESERRRAEQNANNKHANEVNTLERSNRMLEEQVQHHKNVLVPTANKKIEQHTKREKAFSDQIGWLMDATRRESKRMILERFGPGPHQVEITFMQTAASNNNAPSQQRHKFVIDLAPVDLVPHAIHLFLEQVDHGLMDGTQFYLNGPHIVQAGPQPTWGHGIDGNDDAFYTTGRSKKDKLSTDAVGTLNKYEKQRNKKEAEGSQHDDDDTYADDDEYEEYYSQEDYVQEDKRTKEFSDLGLDHLAFPDYSKEFPHVAWTVGFTGRPGGPDWYINKVDNTEGHGPGGQYQYALHEQGDSCFGKISMQGTGRNLLAQQVYQAPIYEDHSEWHHFISNPIEIVHAEILTKDPIMDRHLHLTHLTSQHKVYNHRKKKRHIDQDQMPLHDSTVTHGEGVDPDNLPKNVQESIWARKKGANVSVKKVPHHGHRQPHLNGAVEA